MWLCCISSNSMNYEHARSINTQQFIRGMSTTNEWERQTTIIRFIHTWAGIESRQAIPQNILGNVKVFHFSWNVIFNKNWHILSATQNGCCLQTAWVSSGFHEWAEAIFIILCVYFYTTQRLYDIKLFCVPHTPFGQIYRWPMRKFQQFESGVLLWHLFSRYRFCWEGVDLVNCMRANWIHFFIQSILWCWIRSVNEKKSNCLKN